MDKSKRRAKLWDKLITHMVKNNILSDDALEYISKDEKPEALRIKEMELEHENEMRLRQLESKENKRRKSENMRDKNGV